MKSATPNTLNLLSNINYMFYNMLSDEYNETKEKYKEIFKTVNNLTNNQYLIIKNNLIELLLNHKNKIFNKLINFELNIIEKLDIEIIIFLINKINFITENNDILDLKSIKNNIKDIINLIYNFNKNNKNVIMMLGLFNNISINELKLIKDNIDIKGNDIYYNIYKILKNINPSINTNNKLYEFIETIKYNYNFNNEEEKKIIFKFKNLYYLKIIFEQRENYYIFY